MCHRQIPKFLFSSLLRGTIQVKSVRKQHKSIGLEIPYHIRKGYESTAIFVNKDIILVIFCFVLPDYFGTLQHPQQNALLSIKKCALIGTYKMLLKNTPGVALLEHVFLIQQIRCSILSMFLQSVTACFNS